MAGGHSQQSDRGRCGTCERATTGPRTATDDSRSSGYGGSGASRRASGPGPRRRGLAPAAHRRQILIGFTHAAADRRDVRHLGEPPAVQPRQLGEDEHAAAPEPDVRATTANYLVDQLYANYNVAGLIKSGLPKELQPLAGPAAGRAAQRRGVRHRACAQPPPCPEPLDAGQPRGRPGVHRGRRRRQGRRQVQQGAVTLNLGGILDNIASRLGLPSGPRARSCHRTSRT